MIERKPWVMPAVVSRPSAISPEKQTRIVHLHREGLEVTIIAERLGLHTNTVHMWLFRLGLKKRGSCVACGSVRAWRARCYCASQAGAR